jgi:DNA polymerase I-like protein with 3'-5' exonuclease and polymerase domains
MPAGIRTLDALDELINDYFDFDEFVIDIESKGPHRGDPRRNEVFWISLAGPGRADAIPCGHPIGERIIRDPDDDYYRINPVNGRHQEHQINPSSNRPKWVDVPEPFEDPPKQLWISDVTEALRPLLFSKRRIIGHNVKFDIQSLTKYYEAPPPGPYGDTLVAAKLINENHRGYRPYSLGACVEREFHFKYEKIGKNVDEHPYSEAHLYSYLDAKYTWLLWLLYTKQLKQEEVDHVFGLEMDLLPSIIDSELTGIEVDEKALGVLGKEWSLEMARHQIAINDAAGWEVNLNAKKQVGKLVYDVLGKPCTVFTRNRSYRSTAKETLEVFAKDPTVAAILDYASLNKLNSSFVENIKRNTHGGRTHPSYDQVGAVSGRFSCSDPNIQQVPSRSERGKKVRDVFVAGKDKVLIVCDLSQIELRVLAHFTQDPVLLRAYRKGISLHAQLAERIFGPDYTPFQYSLAKNGHFSVLFGAGPNTMVKKYQFPNVKLAKDVLAGFYDTYKQVQPWKEQIWVQARSKYRKGKTPPYVETILGRKRRLRDLYTLDSYLRSSAERQAISVTISGSAADLFKVSMIECHNLLLQQAWEGHILILVHDELVVEVPEKYADEGLRLVKAAMEDPVNPFTGEPMLSVPVTAEAKIVKRWSEGK